MHKEIFKLRGTVNYIGDVTHIKRIARPDIFKKTLTITTLDNQTLFPEIRNQNVRIIDREGIEVGSFVELSYVFAGSEKNGKRYNNIHVINMIKL